MLAVSIVWAVPERPFWAGFARARVAERVCGAWGCGDERRSEPGWVGGRRIAGIEGAQVLSVSCASPGSCAAGEAYTDSLRRFHGVNAGPAVVMSIACWGSGGPVKLCGGSQLDLGGPG